MNIFQKTLILGVALILVGTSFTSLVGSNIPEDQTRIVTINDIELSDDINVTLNGTMGENGWYISCVYIQISFGPDVVSFWYQFNGGHWKLYTEPFGPICEDGEYTFCWYYVDNEGNQSDVECIYFKIDQTPPTTTHEFEGVVGDNDWFTSNVVVTLTAKDETSGVDYTMYKLDDDIEWQEYIGSILVTEDGEHNLYYYSVDRAGNKEDVNEADFKIDQTYPTIFLTWDAENSKIIADVYDETSGIAKVEFYENHEYVGEVTEPPYEWIYTPTFLGFSVKGVIFNLKITEEIISFFAVIAIGHSIFDYPTAQAIVFDNAGNTGISSPYPPINNNRFGIYLFQQLTFQNIYSGHIGRFFINAVFEYGPL